jgi:hypothetical protein
MASKRIKKLLAEINAYENYKSISYRGLQNFCKDDYRQAAKNANIPLTRNRRLKPAFICGPTRGKPGLGSKEAIFYKVGKEMNKHPNTYKEAIDKFVNKREGGIWYDFGIGGVKESTAQTEKQHCSMSKKNLIGSESFKSAYKKARKKNPRLPPMYTLTKRQACGWALRNKVDLTRQQLATVQEIVSIDKATGNALETIKEVKGKLFRMYDIKYDKNSMDRKDIIQKLKNIQSPTKSTKRYSDSDAPKLYEDQDVILQLEYSKPNKSNWVKKKIEVLDLIYMISKNECSHSFVPIYAYGRFSDNVEKTENGIFVLVKKLNFDYAPEIFVKQIHDVVDCIHDNGNVISNLTPKSLGLDNGILKLIRFDSFVPDGYSMSLNQNLFNNTFGKYPDKELKKLYTQSQLDARSKSHIKAVDLLPMERRLIEILLAKQRAKTLSYYPASSYSPASPPQNSPPITPTSSPIHPSFSPTTALPHYYSPTSLQDYLQFSPPTTALPHYYSPPITPTSSPIHPPFSPTTTSSLPDFPQFSPPPSPLPFQFFDSSSSDSSSLDIYFEPQKEAFCGTHAINNLLGKKLTDPEELCTLCHVLEESYPESPEHYCNKKGNFHHDVLTCQLRLSGFYVYDLPSIYDFDEEILDEMLNDKSFEGFLINKENIHWLSIRNHPKRGFIYLDSLKGTYNYSEVKDILDYIQDIPAGSSIFAVYSSPVDTLTSYVDINNPQLVEVEYLCDSPLSYSHKSKRKTRKK